jgi:hypothetical protein
VVLSLPTDISRPHKPWPCFENVAAWWHVVRSLSRSGHVEVLCNGVNPRRQISTRAILKPAAAVLVSCQVSQVNPIAVLPEARCPGPRRDGLGNLPNWTRKSSNLQRVWRCRTGGSAAPSSPPFLKSDMNEKKNTGTGTRISAD